MDWFLLGYDKGSYHECPYKTILTEQEFCEVLAAIRENYDMREKIVPKLRICEFEDMSLVNTNTDKQ